MGQCTSSKRRQAKDSGNVLSSSMLISHGGCYLSVMRDLYKSKEDKATTGTWCLGVSADGKLLATGDKHGEVKVSLLKVDYMLDLIALDMDSLSKAC